MPKKRKDGRYQSSVTVTDPLTGIKRKVYAYGYNEEELYREVARIKRNNGQEVLSPTFELWKDEWLKIKEDEVTPATLNSYKDTLRLHISSILDKYKLKDITPSLIRTVLRSVNKPRVKEYCYVVINAILQQAFVEDLIPKNPCISIKRPKHKAAETVIISDMDFQAIMMQAKDTQYEGILRLAYDTGMRRSEIAALKWKNIDFDRGIINIEHAVKINRHAPLENRFTIGSPKSEQGIRKISLTNTSKSVLKKQFDKQKKLFAEQGRILSQKDFVFTSTFRGKFGDIMQPDSITHGFVKLKRAAGIKAPITFKSFRHTMLTILAEGNIPAKAIQTHAGHANAAFTLNRYVHKTDKMEKDIVTFLNDRSEKEEKI